MVQKIVYDQPYMANHNYLLYYVEMSRHRYQFTEILNV